MLNLLVVCASLAMGIPREPRKTWERFAPKGFRGSSCPLKEDGLHYGERKDERKFAERVAAVTQRRCNRPGEAASATELYRDAT